MTVKSAFIAVAVALYAAAPGADAPEQPKDVGLVERAATRLAQIDVTVAGPKGAIEGLTADDFDVRVNRKLVPHVLVDNLCVPRGEEQAAPAAVPAPASEQAADIPPKSTVATYLVYFDMPHLTQAGRRGAIDDAREMLPKLLAGGNRATIVVNARDLRTLVPLTMDVKRLDTTLEKMINDQQSFDPFAATEDGRMADVIHELDRGVDFALALARRYAAEERWRQERDLRRLSMVLGRLSELDSPKAVLYFADTMRQNAGEHYLSFFSGPTVKDANGMPTSDAAAILADSAMGALPLDRVMNDAGALGIRFYTIEGQGMTGMDTFISAGSHSRGGGGSGASANQAAPGVNSQRTRDSQSTMVSLAAETGGRAFLNGVMPAKMASQILDDMSCLYLLSFDPSGFPQDSPLAVNVSVNRPKVRAIVRGRLVIQSDSARLTGRMMSAFASPEMDGSGADINVGLIPISYKDGKFKARVQVAVPGSPLPSATWDVGASLVAQGTVWQDGSGRIQVTLPNTPVVYEKDMEFSSGEYDIVAVAHELESDTLASKEVHGSWPKIDAELVSLGPIAVSQQLPGGFLRNGVSQTKGAVIIVEGQAVRADTPTAVITFVCRAKDQKRPLTVVRTLIGDAETPVGTTKLDLSTDRCAQVVDLIPPKMLGAGSYRFVIAVSSEGRELSRAERALVVPEKAPQKSAS